MTALFSFVRVPTQEDFDAFARASGDDNPIHVDPAFSARTRFGRTVAHGMFLYAVLRGALRRARPAAALAETALTFPNPAFAGEALVFSAEAAEGGAVVAARASRVADGAVVCEAQFAPGEAP